MYDEFLFDGLAGLTGLEVYVLAGVDLAGLTEQEVADELTASRDESFDRDRVHGIRRRAHLRLRRYLDNAVAA